MLALVAGLVVAADQATKWFVIDRLGPDAAEHRVEFLGPLFAFEYLENRGAAFGILDGQGPLLAVFAVVVVAVLFGVFLRSGRSSAALTVSFGLLAGGAMGNVVDRVRLGYVVDFVAVGEWPKFNVADSAVTLGVILLAWATIRDSEEPQRNGTRGPHGEPFASIDRNGLGARKTAQREGG